jgi:hypothetical protein
MKHFYAIDTPGGNGLADLDGQLDPTPLPPERFVVEPFPEETKGMASKMIPFTLDNFIKGKDENGKYIIDVTSDEAITKLKRIAMKDTIEERDKLLQETDRTEFPHFPMADERRLMWRTYRQALRDFPNQEFELDDNFRPRRVTFPDKPE